MVKNVLCIILFCVGTAMVWFDCSLITYFGIFFLMWSNNIGIMHTIQKRNKQIIEAEQEFEKEQEIVSHNMRISDK